MQVDAPSVVWPLLAMSHLLKMKEDEGEIYLNLQFIARERLPKISRSRVITFSLLTLDPNSCLLHLQMVSMFQMSTNTQNGNPSLVPTNSGCKSIDLYG